MINFSNYNFIVGDKVYNLDPFYGDDDVHVIVSIIYDKDEEDINYVLDEVDNPYLYKEYLRPINDRLNENFSYPGDFDILKQIGYPLDKISDIWRVSYFEIFDWIFDKYCISCCVNRRKGFFNSTTQSVWECLIIPFDNNSSGILGFNHEKKSDAYVECLELVAKYINSKL